MAKDDIREEDAQQPEAEVSPDSEASDDGDTSSQDVEIIELTDVAHEESMIQADTDADAEVLEFFDDDQTTDKGETTLSFSEPDNLEQAPDVAAPRETDGAPEPRKSSKYGDDVLEITPDDLLDDDALSLAVEETIEALDLTDSGTPVSRTLTDDFRSGGSIDVDDTLDDAFIQSLENFKPAEAKPEPEPEPADTLDVTQIEDDDLDKLLAEMAGEIAGEIADETPGSQKTIVLDDEIEEPDWIEEAESADDLLAEELASTDLETAIAAMDEAILPDSPQGDFELQDLADELEQELAGDAVDQSEPARDIAEQKSMADEIASLDASLLGLDQKSPEAEEDIVVQPPADGGDDPVASLPDQVPAVSEEQLDAALERVVLKLYAEKIDSTLNEVIQRTVNREIKRLKEFLQEESEK